MLHFATFGAYALAFIHGFSAGSDTKTTLVYWIYVCSGVAIGTLLAYRIITPSSKRPAQATPSTQRRAIVR